MAAQLACWSRCPWSLSPSSGVFGNFPQQRERRENDLEKCSLRAGGWEVRKGRQKAGERNVRKNSLGHHTGPGQRTGHRPRAHGKPLRPSGEASEMRPDLGSSRLRHLPLRGVFTTISWNPHHHPSGPPEGRARRGVAERGALAPPRPLGSPERPPPAACRGTRRGAQGHRLCGVRAIGVGIPRPSVPGALTLGKSLRASVFLIC